MLGIITPAYGGSEMSYPNVSDHESRIAALEAAVTELKAANGSSLYQQLIAKLKKLFPFFK